jgi:hypothetical protein
MKQGNQRYYLKEGPSLSTKYQIIANDIQGQERESYGQTHTK